MGSRRPGTSVFFSLGDMLRLMQKLAVLSLILLGAVVGTAQSEKKMPRKVPGASKPECAQGSICFSGDQRRSDVSEGPYRRPGIRAWPARKLPSRDQAR